jgi:hypothetical protein
MTRKDRRNWSEIGGQKAEVRVRRSDERDKTPPTSDLAACRTWNEAGI